MTNVPAEVRITASPLELWCEASPAAGAVVDFWGLVRPVEGDREIEGIEYEAHAAMAEHQLHRIVQAAIEQFDLNRVTVHHRIGFVAVNKASVFVRVTSKHRQAAFGGSQWIMNELKAKVPIWKRPKFKQSDPASSPELHRTVVSVR